MAAVRVPVLCTLLLTGSAALAESPEPAGRWTLPPGTSVIVGDGIEPSDREPVGGSGKAVVIGDRIESPPPATGAAPFLDGPAPGVGGVYASDHASTQVLFGFYSSGRPGPRDYTFSYLPVTFRLGWTPGPPADRELWQGRFEYLGELMAAPIVSDIGRYFLCPAGVVRYNFARRDADFVPYAQLGLGLALNDAHQHHEQHSIGAFLQGIAHVEVGARYFLSDHWSLDIEGGMTHISNSSTADRNYGINAYGGSIGFTYYFPTGER